jgi:molybdenum cofactor guanylyltransferase
MIRPNINGVILAGGRSTRMGFDKSLIKFHGKCQQDYLYDLLTVFCNAVFISRKNPFCENDSVKPIYDHFAFEGPLNGILSAFHMDSSIPWLTVAVDMPLIDSSAIQFLLDRRDSSKVATCFFNSIEKLPEPLFTIWEPSSYPLLMRFTQEGKYSPREFLKENEVEMLVPPENVFLTNINSVKELNLLLKQ